MPVRCRIRLINFNLETKSSRYKKTAFKVEKKPVESEPKAPLISTFVYPRSQKEYIVCPECQRTSRESLGLTKKEGLCANEIILLIRRLLTRVANEDGVPYCLCKDCIGEQRSIISASTFRLQVGYADNPLSRVRICRRKRASVSSAASAKRIDENMALIREYERQRRNLFATVLGGDLSYIYFLIRAAHCQISVICFRVNKTCDGQGQQGQQQKEGSSKPDQAKLEDSVAVSKSKNGKRRRRRKGLKRSSQHYLFQIFSGESKQSGKSAKSKSRSQSKKSKSKPSTAKSKSAGKP